MERLLEKNPFQLKSAAWYRALDLSERLPFSAPATPMTTAEREKALKKVERWKKMTLYRKGTYFADRLKVEGLDEETLAALLVEPAEALQARLEEPPAWLLKMAGLLENQPAADTETLRLIANSQLQPFEAGCMRVIEPLLSQALARLRGGIAGLQNEYHRSEEIFEAEEIVGFLFKGVAEAISMFFIRTMALEVNLARLRGELEGETSEARFENFIQLLSQPDRRTAFFQEYPMLARQAFHSLEHWASYSLEFLGHLCADWPELAATFAPAGTPPGRLVQLDGGAGDSHRQGRSVFKLKFSSGLRLVYKPRSLQLDASFQDLLGWLNQRLDRHSPGFPDFRSIKVVDKHDRGWSEFVETQECRTPAEVERFYRRQGGYLALLYALEAVDFHAENLIAAGEYPVLIDLEALFHPRVIEVSWRLVQDPATRAQNQSVLRVGLLPGRVDSTNDQAGFDISGMGNKSGQRFARALPVMTEVATDQMRLGYERLELEDIPSRPRLDGQEVEVTDFLEAICEGFSTIYRLLAETREEFIAGPLQAFRQVDVRVIARITDYYDRVLRQGFHPDYLRDGLERARILDRLWLTTDDFPALQRLIKYERADLLEGDIPFFTTRADRRDLQDSRGQLIADFLEETSFDATLKRLRQLDSADLKRQLWMIRASFATIPLGSDTSAWKKSVVAEPDPQRKVSPAELVRLAEKVGDRLASLAFTEGDRTGWMGVSLLGEREWKLTPAGSDLYNGTAGIALFLAYLGRLTGQEKYTGLARLAANTVRQQLKPVLDDTDNVTGVSGYGPLSGAIYLYSHLAALWQEPAWLDEAAGLVNELPRHIAADKALDVIEGAAGCIPALLSLYAVRPDPATLRAAVQCAELLVQKAQPVGSKPGVGWAGATAMRAPLVGFSHGTAGIAYNLLQLAVVTDNERYRQVALQALAYERSVFSPEAGNWPDYRSLVYEADAPVWGEGVTPDFNFQPHFMATWCHGAPGIGLSRAALRPVLADDPLLVKEVEAAARTTLAHGFGLNHSLCHGDLGNLEVLQAASSVGFKPQLEQYTSLVVQSIEQHGWLPGIPLGVETPGLMTGLAGIGYGLLKLARPEQVPSVLLLQPPAAGQAVQGSMFEVQS